MMSGPLEGSPHALSSYPEYCRSPKLEEILMVLRCWCSLQLCIGKLFHDNGFEYVWGDTHAAHCEGLHFNAGKVLGIHCIFVLIIYVIKPIPSKVQADVFPIVIHHNAIVRAH